MALHNLAQQSTTTLGTGNITLGPAVSGFLTFSGSGATNGETIPYAISDSSNSETGNGVYTVSGTYGSLVRATVINSTNSGNAISLSGNAVVSITPNTTTFSVPTGTLLQYAAATAPTGYLICNGTAVSRTTYSALFAVLSTTYGTGDGSTTFNLPDLRGRVAVGLGSNASVNALGTSDGVTEPNRRPQHRHTPHSHTYGSFLSVPTPGAVSAVWVGNSYNTGSADGGSGVGTDSLDAPAFLVVNYIIKT
jgi:microcystin-dependent protein